MTFVIAGVQLVITRVTPEDQTDTAAAELEWQHLQERIEANRHEAIRQALLLGVVKNGL